MRQSTARPHAPVGDRRSCLYYDDVMLQVIYLPSGPEAIAQTKACAPRSAWGDLDDDAFNALVTIHASKRQSDEAVEGFAAFLEKRSTQWDVGQKSKPRTQK
jgi:enoyl-CoA hydratase/carnithine racemase